MKSIKTLEADQLPFQNNAKATQNFKQFSLFGF
jgi:hypothetical protein